MDDPSRKATAPYLLQGLLWVALYLTAVLGPVALMLLPPRPGGTGFWWDLSFALGFAGTAMIGVQFVLTARFRHMAAPYGIDVIYYFHRYAAVVGLVLVLAHPLILFADNPGLVALLNPIEAPMHMTAGSVALLALLLLAATSLARKRLHLPYEAWRIAHGVLAVAALALAWVHIDGVGYYSATGWKRAAWAGVAGAWIVLLAYVRVLRPWILARAPYEVVSLRAERGDAWTLTVAPVGHRGLRFEPGQFAWLTLRGSPFALREHPFSISSGPAIAPRLEFTIKELGDFTRTVRTIAPGEAAYVDGPYGAFTIDRYPGAHGYVLIGGGIGVAPLMSMLRALVERADPRPVILLSAHSRWERVPFRDEILALGERTNVRVVVALEEPPADWQGEVGYVTRAMLERHLPSAHEAFEYFLCGPPAMIAAVERSLYQLGVPIGRSHTELFDLV